jgi:hypothetical protein
MCINFKCADSRQPFHFLSTPCIMQFERAVCIYFNPVKDVGFAFADLGSQSI